MFVEMLGKCQVVIIKPEARAHQNYYIYYKSAQYWVTYHEFEIINIEDQDHISLMLSGEESESMREGERESSPGPPLLSTLHLVVTKPSQQESETRHWSGRSELRMKQCNQTDFSFQ